MVARHGTEVTERRRQLLLEAEARYPRGIVPLDVLVNALVRPLLMAEPQAGGRRASMQMHARLFTDPDDTASIVRADIYDETNALYVAAIRRALPKIPAKTLYWRYYFMMGAYVWTLLQPGRLEAISMGAAIPRTWKPPSARSCPSSAPDSPRRSSARLPSHGSSGGSGTCRTGGAPPCCRTDP